MLGTRYPTAAELDAVLAWTAERAPSPLARVIAGVAIRTPELSIGGIRNRKIETELWPDWTADELDRAFVVDRALMVDAAYGFEEQVLLALVYLQLNSFDNDPDRASASNVQRAVSMQFGEGLTLGSVVAAALALGYYLDADFTEADREVDGDAFFIVPEIRAPAPEIFPSRRVL